MFTCLFKNIILILCNTSYGDIIDIQVDVTNRQLRLQIRQDSQLILRSNHSQEIRALIDKMMSVDGGKVN